jgi:glutamate racemase
MALTTLDATERVVRAAGYTKRPAGTFADSAIRTASICVGLAEAIVRFDEGQATIRHVEVVADSMDEANIALRATHTVLLTRELEKAAVTVYEIARSAFLLTKKRHERLEEDQKLARNAEASWEKITGDRLQEFSKLFRCWRSLDRRANHNTEEDKVEVLEVDKEDHQEEKEDTE